MIETEKDKNTLENRKRSATLPAAILLDLDDTILAYGDPEECWLATRISGSG
jgi:hypothetical protein